jgi:hypothetical protein
MRPLWPPELARKAQQKIPGVAVLFTTGYAENAALQGGSSGWPQSDHEALRTRPTWPQAPANFEQRIELPVLPKVCCAIACSKQGASMHDCGNDPFRRILLKNSRAEALRPRDGVTQVVRCRQRDRRQQLARRIGLPHSVAAISSPGLSPRRRPAGRVRPSVGNSLTDATATLRHEL